MGHHAALRVAHQFNNIDKSIVFCCVSEPSTARGSFFGTLVIFVVDRRHRKTFVFLVIYGMVGTLWRDDRSGMLVGAGLGRPRSGSSGSSDRAAYCWGDSLYYRTEFFVLRRGV